MYTTDIFKVMCEPSAGKRFNGLCLPVEVWCQTKTVQTKSLTEQQYTHSPLGHFDSRVFSFSWGTPLSLLASFFS